MAERMSAYEQTRAETIARNRAFLVNLGIDKPLIPTRPAPSNARKAPKRKAPADDESPRERRLTRQSVAPTPTRRPGGGDDDDYRPKEESGSESDDHHEYEEIPKPKPIKKAQVQNIKKAQAENAPETDGSPCIVVEAAKTGRSKCRRCLELLAASALRVGMEVRSHLPPSAVCAPAILCSVCKQGVLFWRMRTLPSDRELQLSGAVVAVLDGGTAGCRVATSRVLCAGSAGHVGGDWSRQVQGEDFQNVSRSSR
jgi:hypothetical protein